MMGNFFHHLSEYRQLRTTVMTQCTELKQYHL